MDKFFDSFKDYIDWKALSKDVAKHVLEAAEKAAADSENTQIDDAVVSALKLLIDKFLV